MNDNEIDELTNLNSSQKPLAISGLVIGISGMGLATVSLFVSFIPCFGVYAMYAGWVSVLLGITSLIIAFKANRFKISAIVAICVTILLSGITSYFGYKMSKLIREIEGAASVEEYQKAIDEASNTLESEEEYIVVDEEDSNE